MEAPRPFRLAAVLVAAALASFYCAFIGQSFIHGAVPSVAPPVLALAPFAYLLFTRKAAATDGLGPRTMPVTVLVTAVAVPVFAAHAHLALALPIIKQQEGRDPAFIDAAVLLVAVLVGAIVLAGMAARALLRREIGAIAGPLRVAAPAVIASAAALVIASLASSRPAPGRWIASRPVVATIPRPSTGPTDEAIEVGDLVVVRRCERDTCGAWIHPRGGSFTGRVSHVESAAPLELRRDAASDLWILDGSAGAERTFIEPSNDRAAYEGYMFNRTAVRPSTLRGSLSPPRGWIVAAAIGAALALRRLARRRAAQRRLDEILAAEAGTLDADGWITLDRGIARLRADTEVAPGPVLVVLPTAASGPAYRSEGARAAERVLAGTRAELCAEARHELATLDAGALVVSLVTAAPLAVAWLEGLR